MFGNEEELSTESSVVLPPPTVDPPAPRHSPALELGIFSASSGTRFGKGTKVRAEITGDEDLYIDGEVEGKITLKDRHLTIGPNGKVRAEVTAHSITVLGRLEGNVRAADRVEIRKTGYLEGDLITARIAIEEDAVFRGSIDIAKPGSSEAGAPRLGGNPDVKTDFEIVLDYDMTVPPETAIRLLNALADYYRACGGLGLEVSIKEWEKSLVAGRSARA